MLRIVNLPGLPPFKVHVRTLRCSCERFALLGASCDFFAFSSGFGHLVFATWAGKAAFVVGALGVVFTHHEEKIEKNGVGYGPLSFDDK